MGTNNVLNQLTFSENGPVKTMLLQQEHFGLVRIALGKGVKIPPHQGGHAVFFLVLQGRGIFTCGECPKGYALALAELYPKGLLRDGGF